MTYYEILEVNENASKEVIHMAYKALCKKYHPDICRGDKKQAEEQMKKINEAYATLSDETKRKQYDAFIKSQTHTRQYSHYQPKQESNVISIDALLKRGFMSLEDGEWSKADHFFELVLNQDAGHAEAYLGKLMVELRVKTKDTLKDCPLPFNDKINYKRAFSFADDSLKQFLKETIQFINKRNYETQCSIIYKKAIALMQQSNNVQGCKDAIAEFEKIRGYKDSDKKIEECYERIAKINSAILAAKENNKEDDKQNDDSSESFGVIIPFIRKNAHILLPLLLFIILVFATTFSLKNNWNIGNMSNNSLNTTTSSEVDLNDDSNNVSTDSHSNTEDNKKTDDITGNSTTQTTNTSSMTTMKHNTSTSRPSIDVSSSTKPSTSTSVSSSSNSDKPAIFGSSDDFNITEGDFIFAFHYDEFGPVYVEVTLIEYNGNSSNVNIPSTVAGYPVTSIGTAFRGNKSITSVNIPKSVKSIYSQAFQNCSSLTSINIPNGVTNISSDTFSYCFSLTSVKIPSSVTCIETQAFAYCTSLTSITIPYGVTYIGDSAFWACQSLTKVTIPNSVTTIGNDAFNSCTSLTSVTIPNSVTTIGSAAFINCRSLKTVTIPDSVTSIRENAFDKCEKLETVYFKSESQMNKYAHLFDSSVELRVLK